MRKIVLICLLFSLASTLGQEKKLLLRFDQIAKSQLDSEEKTYIDKEKTELTGTILIYSKSVVLYEEKTKKTQTFEIGEVRKQDDRTLYFTKDRLFAFALTDKKTYVTKISRKDRLVYRIIDHKYVED